MINWMIIGMTALGIFAGLCLFATLTFLFFFYELRKDANDEDDLLVVHAGGYNDEE